MRILINNLLIPIIALLALSACGSGGGSGSTSASASPAPSPSTPQPTPAPTPAPLTPEEDVNNYVQSFIAQGVSLENTDLTSNVNALTIELVSLGYNDVSGGFVGYCSVNPDNSRLVRFDPLFWSEASDLLKEELVYHELGHCILERAHTSILDLAGNPASIMNPNLSYANIYGPDRLTLIPELFANSYLFDASATPVLAASGLHTTSFDPIFGLGCTSH